ncbi:methyl-accepting chemotaxis protein [Halorientalis salina]|uniref:methyl-accepting chemotaxis protein n=1 Tax=Halorientalis salina TaxID=2932266 RepID=UPI0010AD9676|nr:methyl-accepting chemotaxis protein [Halorientalis salina]
MLENKRITIRNQLLGAFLLVIVFVAVTGFVGYNAVSAVGASADRIVEEDVPVAESSLEMKYAIEKEQAGLRGVMQGTPGAKSDFEEGVEHYDEWATELESHDLTESQRERLEELNAKHEQRVATAREAIAATENGNDELAEAKLREVEESTDDLESQAVAFETEANDHMAASLAKDHEIQRMAVLEIGGLTLFAFLLAGGLGVVLSRRIAEPVMQLNEAAQAISAGRFGERAAVSDLDRNDELADMTGAFQEMRDNLRTQVSELQTVSTNLGEGRLDEEVRTDLPGEFGDIMENVDAGMTQLDRSFDQIQQASENLRRGQLDRDFDTSLPGEYGVVLSELDSGMDHFEQSLGEINAASTALKDGDLTEDLDSTLPGVYGQVMANLDESIDSLEASVSEIRAISEAVAEESSEVTSGAEEVENASEEVASTIEEISAGAERQHENLDQVAGEMNDLSATVEEIASSADEVASASSRSVERGQSGRETAAQGVEAMGEIEEKAAETADEMAGLEAEMAQINEVVDLIDDIAEQTNLLALNASIEAARAGKAGEGFAVVADEIKGLAAETAAATQEVETLVDGVQDSTVSTAEDMRRMRERVEGGRETIGDGLGALDDIVAEIEAANDGVQSISDATDEQAASSQEVVAMVDDVTSVSEETTSEAQNVSAAAEEQTAAITQIAENAESMSGRASELESLVAEFEVDDDGVRELDDDRQESDDDGTKQDSSASAAVTVGGEVAALSEGAVSDGGEGPSKLSPDDF